MSGVGVSLLGRTVAVVSDALPRLLHENRTPGLDLFIQSEAMRLIQGEGLHVLNVNPDHLRPPGLAPQPNTGVPELSVGQASLDMPIGAGAEELLRASPYGLLMTYNIGESPLGQALARRCRQEGVPCVVYGDGPQLDDFDRVTSDHAAGAAALVRWLVSRGRKRILRFWRFSAERNWLSQRNIGFERAIAEAGLELLPAVRTPNLPREHDIEVPGDASRERFATLVRILAGFLLEHFSPASKDRWPDAIMVATDRHAYQVAGALRLLGVVPGRDVTLVGYDNVFEDAIERHFEAVGPAATIDKRNDRIAHQLARLLIDRGAGRVPAQPQRCAVEGELIETDEGE
jgi:DNA-binding LacI/PurR family transcriptional regulator